MSLSSMVSKVARVETYQVRIMGKAGSTEAGKRDGNEIWLLSQPQESVAFIRSIKSVDDWRTLIMVAVPDVWKARGVADGDHIWKLNQHDLGGYNKPDFEALHNEILQTEFQKGADGCVIYTMRRDLTTQEGDPKMSEEDVHKFHVAFPAKQLGLNTLCLDQDLARMHGGLWCVRAAASEARSQNFREFNLRTLDTIVAVNGKTAVRNMDIEQRNQLFKDETQGSTKAIVVSFQRTVMKSEYVMPNSSNWTSKSYFRRLEVKILPAAGDIKFEEKKGPATGIALGVVVSQHGTTFPKVHNPCGSDATVKCAVPSCESALQCDVYEPYQNLVCRECDERMLEGMHHFYSCTECAVYDPKRKVTEYPEGSYVCEKCYQKSPGNLLSVGDMVESIRIAMDPRKEINSCVDELNKKLLPREKKKLAPEVLQQLEAEKMKLEASLEKPDLEAKWEEVVLLEKDVNEVQAEYQRCVDIIGKEGEQYRNEFVLVVRRDLEVAARAEDPEKAPSLQNRPINPEDTTADKDLIHVRNDTKMP